MKKNLITMTILLLAAISVTSCSKENTTIEQPSNCYKVSIRATKAETKAVADGGAATFNKGDVVYVYNNTEGRKGWGGGNLTATSSGKSTTFSGTLNGDYEIGDELILYYKTTSAGIIDNTSQDGALGNVKDAAKAVVTVTSKAGEKPEVTLVTTNASFTNLQSIFRFVFKANGTDELSGIRFVRIFSSDNKLQTTYNVISGTRTFGPITISGSTDLENSDHYIYAGLRFDANPNDEIVFQVVTSDGKVYSGSKTVPAESPTYPHNGFVNGKFYNSTVDVNLYTFTIKIASTNSTGTICFSPGDLGVDNGVYSFTEPFADWGGNDPKRWSFNGDEVHTGKEIYGISWRMQAWTYNSKQQTIVNEWNNIITRSIDGGKVSPYYKATVAGRNYCTFLPPDETRAADIGTDLKEDKNVTDYLKYIAKGFVLLVNTNVQQNNKWKTGTTYPQGGFYWANRDPYDRCYFYWYGTNVDDAPTTTKSSSGFQRLHARYVHDVTL